MDPPSSPPNNFRRTWGEDRTKDRYKDWPWHSSSSLHLCYMRDWHLESAFVYSSLWLNAKYIGVSAQSSQPNTDGNLFNLESESGRNEKKNNAKDRTSRTLVTLVSVRVCVCGSILCWIYFDIWIFTTEKEFEQSSMWSMWSKWIDPQGAEIPLLPGSRRRHKRRSGAMMVAEAFFNSIQLMEGLVVYRCIPKNSWNPLQTFQKEITGSPDPPISSVCWKFGCGSKIIGSNAPSNGCNCIPVSFSSLGLMVGKLLSYPEIWRG